MDSVMTQGPYLRLADVAGVLSVTPRQVRRLVRMGRLAAVRVGIRQMRVEPDELERYIERERVGGTVGRAA
jgi:excisionase family DNA binding protein